MDVLVRLEIERELELLSDEELRKVWHFLKSLGEERRHSVRLRGIWKNRGFEKLPQLKEAIKSVRRELEQEILERKL